MYIPVFNFPVLIFYEKTIVSLLLRTLFSLFSNSSFRAC